MYIVNIRLNGKNDPDMPRDICHRDGGDKSRAN